YDAARRLSDANQARISEIWTYRPTNDGFDLMRMFHDTSAPGGRSSTAEKSDKAGAKAAKAKPAKAAKPSEPVKAAKAKPAKKAAKPKASKPARNAKPKRKPR